MMASAPTLYSVGESCQFDQYGRPMVAHLNLNPRHFPATAMRSKARAKFVKIVIRELFHLLGFSDDMFGEWRVSDLDFPAGRSAVIQEGFFSASDNIGNFRLVTPSVLNAAKSHFNCANLAAVELENFGGPYIAKTFLETRLFRDELLAGEVGSSMAFSPITLGLLKDMGWYRGDSAAVEPYVFIKGIGCPGVASGDCPRAPLNSGYCENGGQASCSVDYRWAASCDYISDLGFNLPTYYQHFSPNIRAGGASAYADYCPYAKPTVDCTDTLLDSNSEYVNYGTSYTDVSRCFVSRTFNFTASTAPAASLPNCFAHACALNGTLLKVRVGRAWYDCPGGSTIDINVDYNGTLTCPAADRISGILCGPGRNRIDVWPTIEKVNATEVNRLKQVLITGSGFSRNITVFGIGRDFSAELIGVTVNSDSEIVATIPNVTTIIADKTPIHLIVVWTDDGNTRRSAYLRNALSVLKSFDTLSWQDAAYQWMFVQNLIFTIIMLCVLALIIFLCIFIIIYRCAF